LARFTSVRILGFWPIFGSSAKSIDRKVETKG